MTPLLAFGIVFALGALVGCGAGIYVCERQTEASAESIEASINEIERIARQPTKPQCARCGTKCSRCAS